MSSFVQISSGYHNSCAIADTGNAYCWGTNGWGQIGSLAAGANESTPFLVTNPVGVTRFKRITSGWSENCAIGDDDEAYCWGGSGTNVGQIGDGFNTNRLVPTKVVRPAGVTKFIDIQAQSDTPSVCATGDDFYTYCWGYNNVNQLGEGTTNNSNIPIRVMASSGNLALGTIATNGRCALSPLPPVAWSYDANNYGQFGDGTTGGHTIPALMTLPSGVNFFKLVSSNESSRCGVSDAGKLYCWGLNSTSGQLGDGTKVNRSTPVLIPNPAGVTDWKAIANGGYQSCGIGSDDKLYCWGGLEAFCCGQTPPGPSLTAMPVTARTIEMHQYSGIALGTDGQAYSFTNNFPSVPQTFTPVPLPGGVTSVKAAAQTDTNKLCIIGNDDQLYCMGREGIPGDGSVGVVASLVPVTRPAAATGFKEVSFSADAAVCALSLEGDAYCWGWCGGSSSRCGNGSPGYVYVPTAVTMPTGVKFTHIDTGGNVITAMGTDGQTYFWGQGYWGGWYATTPALLQKPPGIQAYRFQSGTVSDAIIMPR